MILGRYEVCFAHFGELDGLYKQQKHNSSGNTYAKKYFCKNYLAFPQTENSYILSLL